MTPFLWRILAANSNFLSIANLTTAAHNDWIDALIRADQALFEWILFHLNPVWLVQLAGFLVRDSVLGGIALILWLLYFKKDRKMAFYVLLFSLVATGLSDACASLLKEIFGRLRPVTTYEIFYNPAAFSFPSAHAMNSMTLAILWWMHFKQKGYYFLLLPFVVGICRVISHYHFPGDVLGGWFFGALLGGAAGGFWLYIRSHWLPVSSARSQDALNEN